MKNPQAKSRALVVFMSPGLQMSLLHALESSMSKWGALRLIPKARWSSTMAGRCTIYPPRCLKLHYGSERPVIYVGLVSMERNMGNFEMVR